MTGGRRNAFHHGLRLIGTQLRRGERYRARRAVRLFASFIRSCIREAGCGMLSSLLDALDIPTDVREALLDLGIEDYRHGGDRLYNSLSWLLLMLLSDVNSQIVHHVSIHAIHNPAVIYVSDDE